MTGSTRSEYDKAREEKPDLRLAAHKRAGARIGEPGSANMGNATQNEAGRRRPSDRLRTTNLRYALRHAAGGSIHGFPVFGSRGVAGPSSCLPKNVEKR
jgi:hypothetical protein